MGRRRRTLGRRASRAARADRGFPPAMAEMPAGEIPGSVDVLADLRAAGVRLVALSNWSAEMFPVARERFDFLARFEGIVISGDVGVNKPTGGSSTTSQSSSASSPQRRFSSTTPRRTLTRDCLGFRAIRFTDAATLRVELVRLGVLPTVPAGT